VNNCVKKLNNISIEFIEYDMPIGYIKATNIGIKYALKNKADYICLQNNDTTVTKNWMDLLIEPIKGNIVGTGPTTNSPIAIQGFNKLR
jgi:GT2 family glycosyltransferase